MGVKAEIKVIHKGDVFNTLFTAKSILIALKEEFMHVDFNGFSICVHHDSNIGDLVEIYNLREQQFGKKK